MNITEDILPWFVFITSWGVVITCTILAIFGGF